MMHFASLHSYPPPKYQTGTLDSAPESHTSTLPKIQLEQWEADLMAFFRECKTGIEDGSERERAQEFADRLDFVRHSIKRLHWAP